MESYSLGDILGLGKMCLALALTFLTMTITKAMEINPGAPGWNIFRITDHVSEQYQICLNSLFWNCSW